jgi:hypothetical protein
VFHLFPLDIGIFNLLLDYGCVSSLDFNNNLLTAKVFESGMTINYSDNFLDDCCGLFAYILA